MTIKSSKSRKFCTALFTASLLCLPAIGCGDKAKDEAEAGKAEIATAAKPPAKPEKAAAKPEPAKEAKAAEPAKPAAGPSLQWLKYVPADAEVVAQVSVKTVADTSLWKDNRETLEADPESKRIIESLRACKLDLEKFDSITFAAGEEKLVVVLAGAGLDKIENFSCMHDVAKAEGKGDEWKVEERDGEKVVVFSAEGPGEKETLIGRVANGEAFVVTNETWQDAVKGVIKGDGKSLKDGPLQEVVKRADTSKMMWLAANIPTGERNQLDAPFDALADLTASLDMSQGLALELVARVGEAGKAEAIKSQIEMLYGQYKGFALMVGVPERIANKLSFATRDEAVVASLALTEADITELEALKNQMVAQADPSSAEPAGADPGAKSDGKKDDGKKDDGKKDDGKKDDGKKDDGKKDDGKKDDGKADSADDGKDSGGKPPGGLKKGKFLPKKDPPKDGSKKQGKVKFSADGAG